MKNLFATIAIALFLFGCGKNSSTKTGGENEATAEQHAQEQVKLTGNFGEKITAEGAITTEELLARIGENDSLPVKVLGEILETCKMKGCWMNVALPGEEKMRVTFKDYGFFVPKEGVEGKTAVMDGYVKKVTTDVETLRHFAKDAGKSREEIDAITEPKEEITFVASGVLIRDAGK